MPLATVNWLWIGNRPLLDKTPYNSTSILLSERRAVIGHHAEGSQEIVPTALTANYVSQGVNANDLATVWDAQNKGIAPTTFSYNLPGSTATDVRMISAFAVTMRVQTGSNPDVFQEQPATLVQLANGDMFFRPSAAIAGTWDTIERVYSIQVSAVNETAGTSYGSISRNGSFRPDIFDVAFPCFEAGTLIQTPKGEVAAQALAVGDLVLTVDHGAQPIRWIGKARIDLSAAPNLYPVRIRAGALGNGLPRTDLLVSPQHRVLVRSRIAQRMFGTHEVLVAAKQLLGLKGIELAHDLDEVIYIHFMFEKHQIVWSNGAMTESLFTGPMGLGSVGSAARAEILGIFPDLAEDNLRAPARYLPKGRMARKLADRHLRNGVELIS